MLPKIIIKNVVLLSWEQIQSCSIRTATQISVQMRDMLILVLVRIRLRIVVSYTHKFKASEHLNVLMLNVIIKKLSLGHSRLVHTTCRAQPWKMVGGPI
jgi:hypothetical protein